MLLALLGACDGDAPPPLQRLELSFAGARRPLVSERVVARLDVPADLAAGPAWTVELVDAEGHVVEDAARIGVGSGGARELRFEAAGEARVRIPLELGLASLDALEVVLVSPRAPVVVHARLLRDGRPVLRTEGSAGTAVTAGPQLARLPVVPRSPSASSHSPPPATCDGLELVMRSYRPGWALAGIEAIERPSAARLPHPEQGPAPVTLGAGDARLAVGLSSAAPLEARLDAPADALLSFSYGPGPGGLPAGSDARLLVLVDGRTRRTLPLSAGQPPAWTHAALALEPGAHAVRFELESTAPEELFCALETPTVAVRGSAAPTVLLITSDTHRFDHLGCSDRRPDVRTPTLDALAAEGLVFEDCFAAANVTAPSHVALMTGLGPPETGVLTNRPGPEAQAATLAERFRAAGFRTLAVTSAAHLRQGGLARGFDRHWSPADTSDAEESVPLLARWIAESPGPLFCWLHLFDAHTPYAVPAEVAARHYPPDRDPADPELPPARFPQPRPAEPVRDVEYPRAMYRAEIDHLDRQLAPLLEFERVRAGVVAFTADHGEGLGEHGTWWGHEGLHPEMLHVPLILRWPGGPRGARESRPVHHLDLGRTLLDLAGLERVPHPGTSLVGPHPRRADAPRFALAFEGVQASVTSGSLHLRMALRAYPLRGRDEREELHRVELHDLARDPDCEHDLAATEPETTAALRALLVDWLVTADRRRDDAPRRTLATDTRTLQRLAELGYASGPAGAMEPILGGNGRVLFDPECRCAWCARFVD